MKKITPIVFALILLTGTSGVLYESVFAQTPNNPTPEIYKPDKLIIKFKPGVSAETQNSILSETQNSILSESQKSALSAQPNAVDDLPLLKVKIISVPESALDAVKNALSKNKSVEYVEYVIGAEHTVIPNDSLYGDQWHLPIINAPGAWDITKGGDFPIVILDSGIDMDHPDLATKIIHPYDAENLNQNINDLSICGHGTAVAGAAAAITNNGIGVAGVGWDTKIIPVKITQDSDPQCLGWSDAVLRGVEHAVSKGAKVVNLSYGFSGSSSHIRDAADLMRANDGWLVISAGNSGGFSTKTDYSNIIFVSSTDSGDGLSSFSSYGNYVDISAPGSGIWLTTNGGNYGAWSGTSFSAPITAAILNMLYTIDPTLTSTESFDILKNTAADLGSAGWDTNFGWGRVDAQAAAQEAANSNPPPPVTTPENFKVAFIGDQGLKGNSESVLLLIKNENADMVLHQGDFDYADNPTAWDNQINAFLPGVPYFASVGNHDVSQWSDYQQKLQNRLASISGAVCTGDLGVKSSCHYQGLFFILSGVGTMGSGHTSYIQNELASDDSIWSICSWHKNQRAMQVGGKSDQVGWTAYEACKDGGAIIATAHEHSYERTKTLTSIQNQIVDSAWSNPSEVRVAPGSTFAFVSGLGGQNIRDQERCFPTSYPYGCNGEWANIYTSDQGAQPGALFCEFNVNGQADKATCYFKNISGQTIDTFNITSFMGSGNPPLSPPVIATLPQTLTTPTITIDGTAEIDSTVELFLDGLSQGTTTAVSGNWQFAGITLAEGDNSFTATASDGTNTSALSNTVIITLDTISPVITLNPPNPQIIELGSGYTELGATTDDGSPVIIDDTAFIDAVDTYSILYDSVDASGNAAIQVIRTINVVDTDPETFSIIGHVTILAPTPNTPPVLDSIGDQTVDELTQLSFTATATDTDLPQQTLSFSLEDGVGFVPDGATIDGSTGAFSWTPTESQGPGFFTFDVTVTDNGVPPLADSETITVTVNEVNTAPELTITGHVTIFAPTPNTPPVLDSIGDQTVDELVELTFTVSASDPDVPPQTLSFSLADGVGSVPNGATIDGSTGVFSWTPTESQGPGSFTFDVVVSDGIDTDFETITVTVNEINQITGHVTIIPTP
ncbi:MAG: S8 family serine peptidase [Thaumarchaeota archaeon]|nr:S8 family serine peptidase [Nitrososphaerota archaeon]